MELTERILKLHRYAKHLTPELVTFITNLRERKRMDTLYGQAETAVTAKLSKDDFESLCMNYLKTGDSFLVRRELQEPTTLYLSEDNDSRSAEEISKGAYIATFLEGRRSKFKIIASDYIYEKYEKHQKGSIGFRLTFIYFGEPDLIKITLNLNKVFEVKPEDMTSKCIVCKKVFSSPGFFKTWCSEKCQEINIKRDSAKESRIGEVREYGDQAASATECKSCGRLSVKRGVFCLDCPPTTASTKVYIKNCILCGRTFSTTKKIKSTCSEECFLGIKLGKVTKACQVCGARFVTAHTSPPYCSSKCIDKYNDTEARLERYSEIMER